MRVELIDDFVNQKGKPRVLLEFIPNEFKKDIVYRIVHNPDQNKYIKEVLQKNAMGESVWVFSESWFADNTNNSYDGYELCELIRFLIGDRNEQ